MRTDYKILKIKENVTSKNEIAFLIGDSNQLNEPFNINEVKNYKKFLFKEVKKEIDKNYLKVLQYIVIQYLRVVIERVWRRGFSIPLYRDYFGTISVGKKTKNFRAVSYTKNQLNLNLTADCYKHWFVTYNNNTSVLQDISAYKFTIAKTLVKDYSVHNKNQSKLPFTLMEIIREIGAKHIPYKQRY